MAHGFIFKELMTSSRGAEWLALSVFLSPARHAILENLTERLNLIRTCSFYLPSNRSFELAE